jgi:CelD/BcsL family acetyltransferase involved in cellulose biosynthesis
MWRAAIDQLVERRGLPELASATWIGALWEGFFPGNRGVAVHVLHRGSEVVAAIPVRREGRLLRTAVSLENMHSPLFTLAVDESVPEIARLILDRMLGEADCFELRRFPLDSSFARAVIAAATARGLPVVENENPVGDVRVHLFGPWASFEKTLSKNLRRDSRLVGKLEAMGRVTFDVVEGGERLAAELTSCLELEARGWKGQSGVPILRDPCALAFYRKLAERQSARGRLALYQLKLDGRVIAFEYDMRGSDRIDCLKIGYDESLSKYSPGTILRTMLLKRTIERAEARAYHLGRVSDWKRRWATEIIRLGVVRIFADSPRARLLYFGGPVLRNTVKQLPGARRAVQIVQDAIERARAFARGESRPPESRPGPRTQVKP